MGSVVHVSPEEWQMGKERAKQRDHRTLGSWTPPRRSGKLQAGSPRGVSVQGFLTPEEKQAFHEYLREMDLGVADCVRWLILDAIATKKKPPYLQ